MIKSRPEFLNQWIEGIDWYFEPLADTIGQKRTFKVLHIDPFHIVANRLDFWNAIVESWDGQISLWQFYTFISTHHSTLQATSQHSGDTTTLGNFGQLTLIAVVYKWENAHFKLNYEMVRYRSGTFTHPNTLPQPHFNALVITLAT
jgi:hypothetical protein